MPNTKDTIYEYLRQESIEHPEQKGKQTSEVADALGLQRSNASALLNRLCEEGKLQKSSSRPVIYSLSPDPQTTESSCFRNLIGYNGSLQNAVQLAKAAILYPQKSLNTLILAEHGSGSSSLAKMMFEFAKEVGVLSENAPLVKINCANYAEDQTTLHEALFGKAGNAFSQAEGGMLFLDNIQEIDGKGMDQERISHFLETGSITGQNDASASAEHNIILILGCTKDAPKAVLNRLTAKIPIRIELPNLAQRPLEERFQLIERFLSIESNRSKHQIEVSAEVIRMLLLYDCMLNVKQLNMDIKIACANAYVRCYQDVDSSMTLFPEDFELYVRKGLLYYKQHRNEVDSLVKDDAALIYDGATAVRKYRYFSAANDGYQQISSQFSELEKRGIQQKEATSIISASLRSQFDNYKNELSKQAINTEQLKLLVDQRVISIVREFVKVCEDRFARHYPASTFYGLCLHINALLGGRQENQQIASEQIAKVIENYNREYLICLELSARLKQDLGLNMSLDEVVILTMFIIDDDTEDQVCKPQLLIAMHGDTTASSVEQVIRSLTKMENIHSFNLALTSNIDDSMQELKDLVCRIDQGMGILAIYDMGSLKTMLTTIQEETGIQIRMVNIPLTLIGLDAARKCAMSADVDEAYHSVVSELYRYTPSDLKKPAVYITLCNTGEGGARQLSEYIARYSRLGFPAIPLAISDRRALIREVANIRRTNTVLAFIGTYDPKLFGIPFISLQEIFQCPKESLDLVLEKQPAGTDGDIIQQMYSQLEEDLTAVPAGQLRAVLPGVIEDIDTEYGLNLDQRIGLTMHLACMLDRLLAQKPVARNKNTAEIIRQHSHEFKAVARHLKQMEKKFSVIIPDDEIANVYEILQK